MPTRSSDIAHNMPRRHSALSQQTRFDRARRLAYVVPRPGLQRHVRIPDDDIYRRAKAQVKILIEHRRLNRVCGAPRHFKARAALDAAAQIGPKEVSRVLDLKKSAAKLRRGWSRRHPAREKDNPECQHEDPECQYEDNPVHEKDNPECQYEDPENKK